MISVLIADDQTLVRAGFRMILQAQDDIEVVGETADGAQAVALSRERRPDVVLMDVRMPGMDGIVATRELAGPEIEKPVKVIMLTTYDLDEHVFDALEAGASGFLLKDAPPEDLIRAIRIVVDGDALLAPSVTRRLISEFSSRKQHPKSDHRLETLTARETEILRLMARGHSNAEISAELYVSENTVKTHVAHLLSKLSARDRVQAVVVAYEAGLVQPGGVPGQ